MHPCRLHGLANSETAPPDRTVPLTLPSFTNRFTTQNDLKCADASAILRGLFYWRIHPLGETHG